MDFDAAACGSCAVLIGRDGCRAWPFGVGQLERSSVYQDEDLTLPILGEE
jgi:hypothetical protein